jgi:putative membrane protein
VRGERWGKAVLSDAADDRHPAVLLIAFVAVFAALAYAPLYRQDWLLENLLVSASLGLLIAVRRANAIQQPCLSAALRVPGTARDRRALHLRASAVRTLVPGADRHEFVAAVGLARNHYDRVIHFAYGLLVPLPARTVARDTNLR